jgi:hypothetical protein
MTGWPRSRHGLIWTQRKRVALIGRCVHSGSRQPHPLRAPRKISAARDYIASPEKGSNEVNLEMRDPPQYHITVKRAEHVHRDFGLGCHIEDYSVITSQPAM